MARCETPPVMRFESKSPPPPPQPRRSLSIHNLVHGRFDIPDLYTLKDNDQASNMNNVTPISLKPRASSPRSVLYEAEDHILSILSDATTESSMVATLGHRSLPLKFTQATPPRKRTKVYHIHPEGGKDASLKTVPLPAICKPCPIRVRTAFAA